MTENRLAGRRVLVVEDEYFLADELDGALRATGAVVLGPVPFTEDALQLLEADKPDVAVLDINLSGEMTFGVADALASHDIPFVFTTGYEKGAIPEPYAAVPRLEKPVELAAVLRELERLLGGG